jgi:hypothetical protein
VISRAPGDLGGRPPRRTVGLRTWSVRQAPGSAAEALGASGLAAVIGSPPVLQNCLLHFETDGY